MDKGAPMTEEVYHPQGYGDSVKQSEIPAAADRLAQYLDRLGSAIAVLYERLDAGGVLSPNLPLAEAIRGEERDSSAAPLAMRLSMMAESVESFRDSLDTMVRRLEV